MDQNLNTPQDQVEETKVPSVNTGELTLAYSPFQSIDNFNQFRQTNQFGPQYSGFRPQNVNFRMQQPGCNQQFNQFGQFNQFNQSPCNSQFSQHYRHQQFRPMPMPFSHQFNPFDMLRMIPQLNQFRPELPYQYGPQDYDDPDAQGYFSPEYEQDYPQDMPPQTLPPNHRLERPEQTERPPQNDRPDRPGNSDIARLQAAVQRANNGGRPLTVVQFGDSHVAANTLPESIKAQLNMIAPTDFQAVAKGGVASNYPSLHAQQWLDCPIKGKQPDLVIISFGTNDANAPYNDSQFKGRYQKLINDIKQRSPNTAILVVSAADGSIKGRPLQGIDGVVNAQRELAEKNGLMFLDLRAKMGGPGSINRWRQEKLAAPDLVHFSPAGYRKIGEMTVDAIRQQAGLQNRR
ncbi:MAG: GDSL-type esterase/lipase family protein [Candidatus Melainabacteria bacterium]|nr:GDSL-type esterase/lipase family protein [Candidatus Melainabacteria bacterium]